MKHDSIYWQARKKAENILKGRKGLIKSLTPEQLQSLRSYTGPEIVGHMENAKERVNGYLQRWLKNPKVREYFDKFRKEDRN